LRTEALIEEQAEVYYEDVFTQGSTITNNLGVDLEQCYVLQAVRNVQEGANFALFSPRAGSENVGPYIYAHKIRGGIKTGETINLTERVYLDENGVTISPKDWLSRHSLRSEQGDWGRSLRSLVGLHMRKGSTVFDLKEPFQSAILLATTRSEYDPLTLKGAYGEAALHMSDEQCRQLDLRDLLTKDVVILIGFARDAGPVKLCTRKSPNRPYRPVSASEAWTVYRILIPVRG
jgi:hypothetical protein